MAKQTFTTGQVLTAAQMTSLQQTAMGGGSATAKTASYTLVAADAGATVIMNSASATTITANTSLFSAGDTVFLQNIGAGVCTITAGTATVDTASSLALAQYESGNLYFTAAGASIFSKADGAAGGGGKVLQVVSTTSTTNVNITTNTLTDSGITRAITPTLNTSKILVIIAATQSIFRLTTAAEVNIGGCVLRDATKILDYDVVGAAYQAGIEVGTSSTLVRNATHPAFTILDAPATTSSITYKLQARAADGSTSFQINGAPSTITLLEIGA